MKRIERERGWREDVSLKIFMENKYGILKNIKFLYKINMDCNFDRDNTSGKKKSCLPVQYKKIALKNCPL